MINILRLLGMNQKTTGVFFIVYGKDAFERKREIVLEECADEVMDSIYESLPFRGYVGKYEAYVSVNKTLQEGECVEYRNKVK